MIDEAILRNIVEDDISAISAGYPLIQNIASELLSLRKLAEDMANAMFGKQTTPESYAESLAAYRAEYPQKEVNHA